MSSVSRRRLALVVAVALMLAMTLPSTVLASPESAGVRSTAMFAPDAYENDDTTVTANAVPASSYHTLESSTTASYESDDVDWFKFQVTTTGTPVAIEAVTQGSLWGDLTLKVYPGADGAGNLATTTAIFSVDDSWEDDPSLFATMPAGWYYGKIMGDTDPEAYWLHITQGDARRIYGADRYATNIAATKEFIPDNAAREQMVIANGANFADALAASSLAYQMDAPLMLTPPSGMTQALKDEFTRMATHYWGVDVYIVGGTTAVSTAVETYVKNHPMTARVTRVAGTDRFGTAVALATETSKAAGDQGNRVFLANGLNFADALAVGPIAGDMGNPILLCQPTSISSATVAWMTSNLTTEVVVCGGASAVATSVLNTIQASVPDTQTFVRLGGADRYETSYLLARYGVTTGSLDGSTSVLVSGGTSNWPDGLSAIMMANKNMSPILLSNPTTLSASVVNYYKAGDGFEFGGEDYWPAYAVGGPAALSSATFNAFRDLWKTSIN